MENVRNCGWYAKPAGGAEHSSVTLMSRCVALWLLRFQQSTTKKEKGKERKEATYAQNDLRGKG
jgi:hypothetical protein